MDVWINAESLRVDKELIAKLRALHPDAGWGGWICPRDWVVIEQVLLKYPRENPVVLEVGVFMGGCSNVILTARDDATLLAIDNWSGWSEFPTSEGFMSLREGFVHHTHQYKDRIEIFDGDSIEIGKKWNRVLDVLIVDGDHSYHYASSDIDNFTRWVKSGGYVMVDDYCYDGFGGVKRAVDERLLSNQHYELVRLPDPTLRGHMRGADWEKLIVFRKK